VVVVAGVAAGAFAHRLGQPVPDMQILTQPTEQITYLLSVKLVDDDSREPIRAATVRVTPAMAQPHRMILPTVSLDESPHIPGLYSGSVTFPHPARWSVTVDVTGPVIPVSKQLDVAVASPGAGAPELRVVATTSAIPLGVREWVSLVVLTLHLITGGAWVVALAAAGFVLPALASRAGGAGAGVELSGAIVRRLAAWSWGAAGIMMVTGIYNAVYALPVDVDWLSGGPRAHLAQFARVPLGTTYAGVLFVKHVVIGALLAVLLALSVAGRRAAAPSPRVVPLIRVAAVLGGLVLVQSVGLGYLHRLIAHF
jgi:hypothetical protein